MFRALPAAAKEPWRSLHLSLLAESLDLVRRSDTPPAMMFDVDMNVIRGQAVDTNHEPLRELRKRDPTTHRFLEVKDPILHAHWIPGRDRHQ